MKQQVDPKTYGHSSSTLLMEKNSVDVLKTFKDN